MGRVIAGTGSRASLIAVTAVFGNMASGSGAVTAAAEAIGSRVGAVEVVEEVEHQPQVETQVQRVLQRVMVEQVQQIQFQVHQ